MSMLAVCGAHCGIKDNYEGHCNECHKINRRRDIRMGNHLMTNNIKNSENVELPISAE